MLPFAVHTIISHSDYEVIFEEFRDSASNQIILVHLEAKRFSPSVLKHMRRDWRDIRSITQADLFAIEPSPNDTKWERFAQPFGFQYFRTVNTDEGPRRMFVSRAKTTFNELQQSREEHPRDNEPEPDSTGYAN